MLGCRIALKVSDMINLKKIFSRKLTHHPFLSLQKKPIPTVLYAPGTQIVYDTSLVARLKNDHSHLIEVFTDIVSSIERRDYDKIKALNEVFLALFNAHALLEYTKLYVFLDYSFRSDKRNHDVILQFRREMNDIGKAVRSFCHHWRKNAINDASLYEFKKQIKQIGEVLTQRIDVEEHQLYELYDTAPSRFASSSLVNH